MTQTTPIIPKLTARKLDNFKRLRSDKKPRLGHLDFLFEHILSQFRKNLRNLAQHIVAIAASKVVNTGSIPAVLAIILGLIYQRQGFHLGVEGGIEEKRVGVSTSA